MFFNIFILLNTSPKMTLESIHRTPDISLDF